MKVVVGFSRPKKVNLGTLTIMAWMCAPYSHVYIRVYSRMSHRWLVYQAAHGSVHCITFENFKKRNNVYKEFHVDTSVDCFRTFLGKAQDLLGVPYGYIGLAKIVLKRLGISVIGDGAKSFHCSELVAALLPDLFPGNTDFLEPVHLYRVLAK